MILTSQQHDYSIQRTENVTATQAYQLFQTFPWEEAWQQYYTAIQNQEEACPPGIILGFNDIDPTLHFFMENEHQIDVFFDYAEKIRLMFGLYRTTRRIHNFRANLPTSIVPEMISLFVNKEFETLEPHTIGELHS